MSMIMVVDDELGIRELLLEILHDEGHTVELAENAAKARQLRKQLEPDLVLLDIWMPDSDGVSLLKEWATSGQLTMPVVMMSGHGSIETAVEATRLGAFGYLEKPITLQKLLMTVDKALVYQAEQISKFKPKLVTPRTVEEAMTGGALPAKMSESKPVHVTQAALDLPLREARDVFEKAYFEYHLQKEAGSMTRVADKTGLERTHLYRKLKQLGIEAPKSKRS